MKNIIIAVLCIATCIITWSNSIVAQTEQYRHELQIGYYKAEFSWPGIGAQYQYFVSNYFSLNGGMLMYNRQSPSLSIVDYMSNKENKDRLFAQVPYYEPLNQSNLGKDQFDQHKKIYDNTYSLFVFAPEIGVGVVSPKILKKRIQLSLNYSVRLVMFSNVFLTEIGPMLWNNEDTEFRYYTIYYYQRHLGPIGFNLKPSIKFFLNNRTFLGFEFYFHGYDEPLRNIHYAALYPFYAFYASYGFTLGTNF